jgi:hypothetical protein
MKKQRYFSTRSRPLVEFLYAKGHPIAEIRATGMDMEYILPKTPTLEALVAMYRFGADDTPELFVQVRDFQRAQQEVEYLKKVNAEQQIIT